MVSLARPVLGGGSAAPTEEPHPLAENSRNDAGLRGSRGELLSLVAEMREDANELRVGRPRRVGAVLIVEMREAGVSRFRVVGGLFLILIFGAREFEVSRLHGVGGLLLCLIFAMRETGISRIRAMCDRFLFFLIH